MNAPRLAIVIPCHNEQEALPKTLPVLVGIVERLVTDGKASADSRILCVDDGSTDGTWSVIEELSRRHDCIHAIALTKNFGQQSALMAGLMEVRQRCDIAVTLDADLQDDPGIIGEMIELYRGGADIVYGVRNARPHDTVPKKMMARGFYRIRKLIDKDTIPDHSDFRLMSREALDRLSLYDESNLYLRGIMPRLGGNTARVAYTRGRRVAGKTKYEGHRMLSLALDGITSFSSRPIRLIFLIGLLLMVIDIAVAVYVFISYFGGSSIPGWTSLMMSVWFLGSLILMSIGIVGEYIGKIFTEVKSRPRYHISRRL